MAEYKVPSLNTFGWQPSVLDKDLNNPPESPTKGDRYIVGPVPTSGWSGHAGDITLFNTTWEFITKKEGMACYVKDEDKVYIYVTTWVSFDSLYAFDSDGLLTEMPVVDKSALRFAGTAGEGSAIYSDSQGRFYVCSNCYFDGTNWMRINTSRKACAFRVGVPNGAMRRYWASAGTNPISSWDLANGEILENTANKDAASGYAGLDGSQKVIKDPANATSTPTVSKIPIAGAGGILNLGWLGIQKARAFRNNAQAIPSGVITKIGIDADSFDPDNITDLTNHRIIPNKAGYYIVIGNVGFSHGVDGAMINIFLLKNGTDYLAFSILQPAVTGTIPCGGMVVDIVYFNGTTDYIELYVQHYFGINGNLAITNAFNYLGVIGGV